MNTFSIRALLCCSGMGVSLFASGKGKLNGTVLDEHGQGADAATVMLTAPIPIPKAAFNLMATHIVVKQR